MTNTNTNTSILNTDGPALRQLRRELGRQRDPAAWLRTFVDAGLDRDERTIRVPAAAGELLDFAVGGTPCSRPCIVDGGPAASPARTFAPTDTSSAAFASGIGGGS